VCVVPHRALHYIPFQALNDGKQFLIESRMLFYAPSASALIELKKSPPERSAAMLVFDPILSEDPKSPFSKTESKPLREQHPKAKFIQSREATLAAFREAAPAAGILHISSHGFYDEWIPLESGLLFAGEQMLKARDIYGLRLEKTELVVMSACVSSV